jgi:hypothetical protein
MGITYLHHPQQRRLRHTLLRDPQHIQVTTAMSPGATLTVGAVTPGTGAVVLVTAQVLEEVEDGEDAEEADGRNIPSSPRQASSPDCGDKLNGLFIGIRLSHPWGLRQLQEWVLHVERCRCRPERSCLPNVYAQAKDEDASDAIVSSWSQAIPSDA